MGVRPMTETVYAVIISIVIVLVAVAVIFAWFGGLITPSENALQSSRNLAEAIDTLGGCVHIGQLETLRSCNEIDMAVFPNYRLIVDRKERGVTPQYKCTAEDEKCEEGKITDLETNKFRLNPLWDNAICSHYFLDASEHTTHCDMNPSLYDFKEGETFNANDYLIINTRWTQKITGTYCVCAMCSSALLGDGKVLVYPKGWSPTCGKALDKIVVEPIEQYVPEKIKEAFVSAYERIKNWLRKWFD